MTAKTKRWKAVSGWVRQWMGGGDGRMLLDDWLTEFVEQKQRAGCRPNYLRQLRDTARVVRAFRPAARLREVDKKFVQEYIIYIKGIRRHDGRPLAGTTVFGYFKCLNLALNAAVRRGLISRNPVPLLASGERPRQPESTREFLAVEEVKRLMTTPRQTRAMERAAQAFLFACFCGLRISDLTALRWCDIHADGGKTFARITVQKTRRQLTLPLSAEALSFLPIRPSGGEDAPVFRLPELSYANKLLKRWAAAAGIRKKVTYHVARHTFATLCLTADVPIEVVSKLLGHRQIKTTQIYAKVIDKKKQEAVERVEALFR